MISVVSVNVISGKFHERPRSFVTIVKNERHSDNYCCSLIKFYVKLPNVSHTVTQIDKMVID